MLDERAILVLLVDDDALVLAATSRLLRKRGMRTICATSPFGVSALVRREAPDVVVLDLHMPGLDGAHLMRLLCSSPRTAGTPVVLHSADAEEVLGELANSLGAHYSVKGRGLVPLVEAILAAARAPRSGSRALVSSLRSVQGAYARP
jgi:CheY-like chemotaxis protein